MKLLLSAPAMLLALSLPAQISIHPEDMPQVGDTVRYVNSVATGIDPEDTGADHLWNFSALPPLLPGADTIVSVGSTPFLYQLFFNNGFLYPEHRADIAMRGPEMDFQVVAFEDLYDYYANDEESYRNVGFGATINGLPASIQREPIDIIHRFPLQYGDVDSSASAFSMALPTIGYFGQSQVRRNVVDGWGTLILPTDTFEVLRVRSAIERSDTIYMDQLGLGFAVPEPETVEYKWLATGMARPVLEVITVAGLPVIVRFHHEMQDISTGIVGTGAEPVPLLYPNPAQDHILLRMDRPATVQVFAMDGRLVLAERLAAGLQRMDVETLVPGVYTVKPADGNGSVRLVIAR